MASSFYKENKTILSGNHVKIKILAFWKFVFAKQKIIGAILQNGNLNFEKSFCSQWAGVISQNTF